MIKINFYQKLQEKIIEDKYGNGFLGKVMLFLYGSPTTKEIINKNNLEKKIKIS